MELRDFSFVAKSLKEQKEGVRVYFADLFTISSLNLMEYPPGDTRGDNLSISIRLGEHGETDLHEVEKK